MSGFSALATLALVYGKVVLSAAAGKTEFCDINLGGPNNHLGFDDSILHVMPEKRVFSANRPPNMTRATVHWYAVLLLMKRISLCWQQLMRPKVIMESRLCIPFNFLFVDCESSPMQVIEITISDDVGNN